MFCKPKSKCCICLEYNKIGISCKHCNEGIICKNCVSRVIEECKECPICRQNKWHSHLKTKIIPVNDSVENETESNNYTRERKLMFYWFFFSSILSFIFCTCALGYLSLLLICGKDTIINLGYWSFLISPLLGILEIFLILATCCKGCNYQTLFLRS